MQAYDGTIDPKEVEKFEAMAADWWNPDGRLKPLHQMNPCRLDYVTAQIAAETGRDLRDARPFEGLRFLDIGCGGGLLSEPMARLGATILGADAAAANIEVARVHATQSGLAIDYRHTTAEALAEAGETFEAVLAMEIVEHVADPAAFLSACGAMVKPGGLLIASTLNRTAKSYALAIIGAEYILGWLPRGTHNWQAFPTPDELAAQMAQAGVTVVDRKGFVFDPFGGAWSVSERDLSVNYVMTAVKETP
ncbi:MAG: bifunctional 2-polyprenyl-6-hydroxyphenol methylase/3-demethylubiquinol 3-O-methyltransferase UbiG [Pseudomonadota bacterium]